MATLVANYAKEKLEWLKKSIVVWKEPQAGKTTLGAIATMLVTGLMVLVFIINVVPMIEELVVPETITNEFVATMLEMAIWVLPIGAVMALFVWIFRKFK